MKQMAAYIEVEGRDPVMIETTARGIAHVREKVERYCPPSAYLMAIFEMTPYQYPDLVWSRYSGFDEYYWNRLQEHFGRMISFEAVQDGCLDLPAQTLNTAVMSLAAAIALITPLALLFLVIKG